MATEKIDIDELLKDQSTSRLTYTVEAGEGNSHLIAITPRSQAAGCACQLAIKVPKESVDFVTPTGDKVSCCGKTLRVVELQFKEGAHIALADLFAQINDLARATMPSISPTSGFRRFPSLDKSRFFVSPSAISRVPSLDLTWNQSEGVVLAMGYNFAPNYWVIVNYAIDGRPQFPDDKIFPTGSSGEFSIRLPADCRQTVTVSASDLLDIPGANLQETIWTFCPLLHAP